MTAVGIVSRLLSGESRSNGAIQKGAALLMSELPLWREYEAGRQSKVNFYYWYYGTQALFFIGGETFDRWRAAMVPTLILHQRREGCERGSWDPIGEWGPIGGRVYSTALATLALEIAYRYHRTR
jgi:hypothetical protein